MDIFSDEFRRNPFPMYEKMRSVSPVLRVPPPFDANILQRLARFELASDKPWPPRRALHVHGPAELPIRFEMAWFFLFRKST
jgi:hypothetical protein